MRSTQVANYTPVLNTTDLVYFLYFSYPMTGRLIMSHTNGPS